MIPRFLRPEVWPFTSSELVQRLTDTAPATLVVVCAWCPGFVPSDKPAAGTTHGICQACSDLMIFEAVHAAERLDELAELGEEPGSACSRACGFCGRCS